MRVTRYQFPGTMSIREIALATKQDIEGRVDILSVPDDVSDEVLERNFSKVVNCRISTAKNMLKKYGGAAWTDHFERDGGFFESTPVKLKGNNSRHKYNRHL